MNINNLVIFMKKIISLLIALTMCILTPTTVYATENKDENIKAKSVILMSTDNKQVLYEENSKEHLSPASVTKIMSILLVVEALESGKIKLTDKVTASKNAVAMGGSQIWLELGEIMTVDELLKAVIVASANDACTALGEYVSGSSVSFVRAMNERAKELGLKDTNFENCTGLDDSVKNHYSCAYDLAVISSEVMKHDIVKNYTNIWLDSLRDGKTELNNTNKLVNTYNGITGLKTGTTSNAGFCISATASRDGLNLVAVVLGSDTSENRFDTASYLLDMGFADYCCVTPKIDKSQINSVQVKYGKEKSIMPRYDSVTPIVIKKGSEELKYEYKLSKSIQAPVKKGQKLGEICIKSNNKIISKINLTAGKNIGRIDFATIFKQLLTNI